uniref:Fibroblast growth factor 4 n=1 Tax=Sinocyclocheilus anshuiensis TaxID=1608454 RepID=A0A671QHR1_9TELE
MSVHSNLLPILVLRVMTSSMAAGQNEAVERCWETLYSRSLARIPGEKRDISQDSAYLTGIKRLRPLYRNAGIGFHLQVLPGSRISGVHNENRYRKFHLKLNLVQFSVHPFSVFSYRMQIRNSKMGKNRLVLVHSCNNVQRGKICIQSYYFESFIIFIFF